MRERGDGRQADNNIVTYTTFAGEESAVWASNTCGKGVGLATLALGDLGLLILVDEVPSRPT